MRYFCKVCKKEYLTMKDFPSVVCVFCKVSESAWRNVIADELAEYKNKINASFGDDLELHHGAELLKLWVERIGNDFEGVARYGTTKHL